LVLVLVAGGLVANALHTAHEAGWLDFGQGRTLYLSRLVRPGSVRSSLLTGMLGVQAHPVTIELVGWAAYVLPATCYVAAPPGRRLPRQTKRILATFGATATAGATVLVTTLPAAPQPIPTTAGEGWSAQVTGTRPDGARMIRTQARNPVAPGNQAVGGLTEATLAPSGTETRDGLTVVHYTTDTTGTESTSRPTDLAPVDIAALNGGRLPLGTQVQNGEQTLPVRYQDVVRLEAWVQPATDRVVDLVWTELVTVSLVRPDGSSVPLAQPAASGSARLPEDTARAAQRAATADLQTDRTRSRRKQAAETLAALAAATLTAAGLLHAFPRPRRSTDGPTRPVDVAALR
jgi:high-affinity iron transporter